MALYGAPVWVDALTAKNRALLRRPQRVMAVRAIRGYRTVSYDAACAIAGMLPWELEAEVLAKVYQHKAEAQADGCNMPPDVVRRIRDESKSAAMTRWEERLATPSAGIRTVEAIRPVLGAWMNRRHGHLTFRLVQVLTGHGCFGKYLHQIARKEDTPACHHCSAAEDSAQHTLQDCPAWSAQRQILLATIGPDLSLPGIVTAMLNSEMAWEAFASFCEDIITQKEAAERIRENLAQADSLRRRRVGVRRRRYDRLLPP